MRILISNDDGYGAPGIEALACALESLGEVTVVAPGGNRSGASNALSIHGTIGVRQAAPRRFIVDGTPADCVHLAMTGLLEKLPDIVVSGINCGSNLGDDTLYSGTVAAAREGYMFGVDAIAFSQIEPGWAELESAAGIARVLVRAFLDWKKRQEQTQGATLLNVNIPMLPAAEVKGFRTTRLGRREAARPAKCLDRTGDRSLYSLGPAGDPKDAGIGTDFAAVRQGYVTVTPLQVDFTDVTQINPAASWVESVQFTVE